MGNQTTIFQDLLPEWRVKLLKEKISEIEQILKSDVIAFYASIDSYFIDFLIDRIEELKKEGKYDNLSILIYSNGGDVGALSKFYSEVFKVHNFENVIIPEHVFSAATGLTFIARNIYINGNKSAFGMIDEQIDTVYVNHQHSIYNIISGMGVTCEFKNDTSILEESITFDKSKVKDIDLFSVNGFIDKIKKHRKFYFQILTEKNLYGLPNKENIAIRIINYLSDLSIHFSHSEKINPEELRKFGLSIINCSGELSQPINEFHSAMINVLQGKYGSNWKDGNFIQSIIFDRNGYLI